MDTLNYKCQICFNNFNFERNLPRILGQCGHTVCMLCIEKMIKETKEKFKDWDRWLLKCPFDQIGHLLTPETKAEHFPKNFILIEMISNRGHEETFNI